MIELLKVFESGAEIWLRDDLELLNCNCEGKDWFSYHKMRYVDDQDKLKDLRKIYYKNQPKSIKYFNVKNEGGHIFLFRPGVVVPFLVEKDNIFDVTITESRKEK